MHILIFGSTGTTGILLARKVLDTFPSCTLVLYARNPNKIPADLASNTSVTVVEGDLENNDRLSDAMDGVDAIISLLGPIVSLRDGPFHPSDTPLAHAYERIIAQMRAHGIKRLIALGTASISAPEDKFSLKYATLVAGVAIVAYNSYKDVVAIGETISSTNDIDWTIARVPFLTNSDRKDIVVGYIGDGKTGTVLSRAALASFMVKELSASEWVQQAPLITLTCM